MNEKMAIRVQGKGKFTAIYHEVLRNMPQLSNAEFRVYCVLKSFAGYESGEAYPSYKTIMETCGMGSRTTLSKCLEGLVHHGLLDVEQRRREGSQELAPNLYTIYDSPKNIGSTENGLPDLVQKMDYPSPKNGLPLVQKMDYPSPKNGLELEPINENQFNESQSSQSQCQTDEDIDFDTDFASVSEAANEKEPQTVSTSRGSISNNAPRKSVDVPPHDTTGEAQVQYDRAQQQLEIVKHNIDYADIEDEDYREKVDGLLASMEEVFMSNDGTVKIAKTDMPRIAVISTYLKLTRDHIDHVLDRFKTVRNPIKHVHAYLKTCLYRSYQEYDPHVQNLVSQHYG